MVGLVFSLALYGCNGDNGGGGGVGDEGDVGGDEGGEGVGGDEGGAGGAEVGGEVGDGTETSPIASAECRLVDLAGNSLLNEQGQPFETIADER